MDEFSFPENERKTEKQASEQFCCVAKPSVCAAGVLLQISWHWHWPDLKTVRINGMHKCPVASACSPLIKTRSMRFAAFAFLPIPVWQPFLLAHVLLFRLL